jgi:hypothetical protein
MMVTGDWAFIVKLEGRDTGLLMDSGSKGHLMKG